MTESYQNPQSGPRRIPKFTGQSARDRSSNPITPDAGYLHDEPLYEPWREAMEENRRKLDEDPEAV